MTGEYQWQEKAITEEYQLQENYMQDELQLNGPMNYF